MKIKPGRDRLDLLREFGRRTNKYTVGRDLSKKPIPLRMMKCLDLYYQIPEIRGRRLAW